MAKAEGERYTVAVDFDGVLHSYTTQWVNAETIPDLPVPGAIEWLRQIEQHFNVVIFTTRGKTPEGQRAVRHYLHEHGWESGMKANVTADKPPALVYIDDRAWRFVGRFPSREEIHQARPWRVGEGATIASEGPSLLDFQSSTPTGTSVLVRKLPNDPLCLHASLGGTRGDGYYLTFRGPMVEIDALLEAGLTAIREGRP